MRKTLLAVLAGSVVGLAAMSAASAAPINGTAVGNSSEAMSSVTQVQHWRWGSGGHWRWGSRGGCFRVRVCGPYRCWWQCR